MAAIAGVETVTRETPKPERDPFAVTFLAQVQAINGGSCAPTAAVYGGSQRTAPQPVTSFELNWRKCRAARLDPQRKDAARLPVDVDNARVSRAREDLGSAGPREGLDAKLRCIISP